MSAGRFVSKEEVSSSLSLEQEAGWFPAQVWTLPSEKEGTVQVSEDLDGLTF